MQKVDVEIKKDRIYAVVIILAVVILTFMRSAYSPIYRYVFCPDSICYRIMTRGLLAGRIPYRDLFDHKGPLSYFIYAIGLLISGGRTWGMCLISCVINAISFLFVYKTARIRYCREVSLLGIAFVLFMCSLTNRSPLNTLNAPDDFLLLPLMVSAYLIFKEVASQKEGFDHLSRKTMFITGIMCGAVLWIKLNVCLFYFAFIGCYFLWLIIKRRFKAFLENTAVFLGGIAAMTVVALAFYAVTGTLGNLWESYISFNLFYSSVRDAYWIFDKVLITFITKVSVSLMLLICALAFLLGLLTKRLTRQHIVTSILLLINYLVLTYFAVYD